MTKILTILLVFICLTGLIYAAEKTTQVPDAPNFVLEDVNGKVVRLDSLVKKGPVLMSFWALWCKMCIKELDALKPYYPELESLGASYLAISQDKSRSVPEVKPFAASHKWQYQVVLDPDNKLRDLYKVQVMPSFFIIDQNKKIVFTHQGYKPGDEKKIMEKVRELLKCNEECEKSD
jgi:cytochrome c biogenesis protein CcmG/thiol:disulfide interchange protein DsbE